MKNQKKEPPFEPEREIPTRPDPNPDPTKKEQPQKNDPTRIKEPGKTDPTRIDPPHPGSNGIESGR